MKKIIPLIVFLALISITISQTSTSQSENRDDFNRLTFEAELNKQNYLPFEPIVAKFKVSNNTGVELTADQPDILRQAVLRITDPAGKEQKITSLSISSGGGTKLPGSASTIQPSQVFEVETILPLSPDIFEKEGAYQLQFSLNKIKSNPLRIVIDKPSGIDKDAFEFLKKHGKDPNFGAILWEKNGPELLEKFAREFAASTYGDYACSSLGRYYLYNGEAGKARIEFEKLINSEIKLLAERSKRDLDEAERKLQQRSTDQ